MTAPAPATENATRLRKSCDRCQTAKVKCSRVKPSCWRCSQDGRACVYSPSRRTGRPRKTAKAVLDHGAEKTQEGGSSSLPRAKVSTSRKDAQNEPKLQSPMQLSLDTQVKQEPEQDLQQQVLQLSNHHNSVPIVATDYSANALAPLSGNAMDLEWDQPAPVAQNDSSINFDTWDPMDPFFDFEPLTTAKQNCSARPDKVDVPGWSNEPADWLATLSPLSNASAGTSSSSEPSWNLWDEISSQSGSQSGSIASVEMSTTSSVAQEESFWNTEFDFSTRRSQSVSIDELLPQSPSQPSCDNCSKCYKLVLDVLGRLNEQNAKGHAVTLENLFQLNHPSSHAIDPFSSTRAD